MVNLYLTLIDDEGNMVKFLIREVSALSAIVKAQSIIRNTLNILKWKISNFPDGSSHYDLVND